MHKLAGDLSKAIEKRFGRHNIVINDNFFFFIKEYISSHAQDLFDIKIQHTPQPNMRVDKFDISIFPKQTPGYMSISFYNSRALYEDIPQE